MKRKWMKLECQNHVGVMNCIRPWSSNGKWVQPRDRLLFSNAWRPATCFVLSYILVRDCLLWLWDLISIWRVTTTPLVHQLVLRGGHYFGLQDANQIVSRSLVKPWTPGWELSWWLHWQSDFNLMEPKCRAVSNDQGMFSEITHPPHRWMKFYIKIKINRSSR